jgi:poly(3-hydroxybutyrate) depolymerase
MRLVETRRSRRRVLSLAVAAVAALGLVAPARASAVNEGVPFMAQMSGTAAFIDPTTAEFHGGGQATFLGQFVSDGVAVLDAPTGTCPGDVPGIPNVHTETLIAANGDQLVIRMVNFACPTGPFTFHGTGHWTVPGGTGRFENVTGEGTIEGDANFETSTFALTLIGALWIKS